MPNVKLLGTGKSFHSKSSGGGDKRKVAACTQRGDGKTEMKG